MKIEQQYISLFAEQQVLIDNNSTPVLNKPRAAAMANFSAVGLPTLHMEAYKYCNVKASFAPDYGLNLQRLPITVNVSDLYKCNIPNLATTLFSIVNDSYLSAKSAKLPTGVIAGGLKELSLTHPQLVAKYYNKLAETHTEDGIVSLNTAYAQDGFLLYIPAGVVVEKPLQLLQILRGEVDFMVNRRLLIVVEDGASVKLLACDHVMSDVQFLVTQVTEIFLGKNSVFDFYEMEDNNKNTARFSSTFVHQEEGSNTLFNGITLHNGVTRNNYYIDLAGAESETLLAGMAICDGEQQIDNYSHIRHLAPHCTSNELFKYVLDDRAQGTFTGRIYVNPGAYKTVAYQSNKNLCISPTAKVNTRPQLEIYADDVKCSHGATVGQLDTNALFYMRTRGLSYQEARLLLMFAFTHDVIEHVRIEGLAQRLRSMVEKRFRGEHNGCAGCQVCQ